MQSKDHDNNILWEEPILSKVSEEYMLGESESFQAPNVITNAFDKTIINDIVSVLRLWA